MAKRQPKQIPITTQPGQISAPGGELTNYFVRLVPNIINPQWQVADLWRDFVKRQQIAVLCRDAISNYLTSLDWTVGAFDVNDRDSLRDEIKYYTKLLERGNAYYYDIDFTSHIEWIIKDLFDLPFGAASEYGRENDDPEGKIVWIRPLDAGTLDPTLNKDFPIMQSWPSFPPVFFPRDTVSRVYLSPRTEIRREGWGMAPPEKIYMAMEMLSRGDNYYAQLLINTPEAGILDLMDMEETDALKWVQSFRDMMFGINPLKIPVLYQHTSKAEWIPFGKLPSEILYDSVTSRYITIVTAGYGLSPSDIGFPSSSNGGETLSGTIRQERRSARSGKALAKKKTQAYFNNMLPESLRFRWIDSDDEKAVAMSRARMADANAAKVWIDSRVFTPGEVRRQAMADGLVTVDVPEEIDINSPEFPALPTPFGGGGNKLSNQVGAPKAPSQGGQGGVIPQQVISRHRSQIETSISKAVFAGNSIMGALINSVREKNNFEEWEAKFDGAIIGKSQTDDFTQTVIDDTLNTILPILESREWPDTVSEELVKILFEHEEENLKSSLQEEMLKQAEEEYIQGTREDILLTEEENLKLQQINLSKDFPQIKVQVRKSLLDSLASIIMLVSKNEILNYKFDIDVTALTDNNTLKLAREVSAKTFDLLPKVVNDLYWETYKSLISDYRSNENASN